MKIIYTCPQCGHDLQEEILAVNPPIHKKICHNCGWNYEWQEKNIRIPFTMTVCNSCLNYSFNKENRVCNCTIVGLTKVVC